MTQEADVRTDRSNDKDEKGGGQSVTFEHVNSLQEVQLHASKDETLRQLWEDAYVKLGEPHRPDDRLQTDDGRDLMPFLGLTLRQLREEQQINSHKFQIVGPTGGAAR